jgi:hypothetical protein
MLRAGLSLKASAKRESLSMFEARMPSHTSCSFSRMARWFATSSCALILARMSANDAGAGASAAKAWAGQGGARD